MNRSLRGTPSTIQGRTAGGQSNAQVARVITPPPCGPSADGLARTPCARPGRARKISHRYGRTNSLARLDPDHLADDFTQILTGAATIVRPGGTVAVTARPYCRYGELIDIPGMVATAGISAGLRSREECAAHTTGIRDGRLITRGSFFQQRTLRAAIVEDQPQSLLQCEDVVIFEVPETTAGGR